MSTTLAKRIYFGIFQKTYVNTWTIYRFLHSFYQMNHKTLTIKLNRYGIRGAPFDLVKSCLSLRGRSVTINGHQSAFKPVTSGVPQGSILNLMLFNFYINDITNVSMGSKFLIFTDNSSLFFCTLKTVDLMQIVNNALTNIYKWSICNDPDIINRSSNQSFYSTNKRKGGRKKCCLDILTEPLPPPFLHLEICNEHLTTVYSLKNSL